MVDQDLVTIKQETKQQQPNCKKWRNNIGMQMSTNRSEFIRESHLVVVVQFHMQNRPRTFHSGTLMAKFRAGSACVCFPQAPEFYCSTKGVDHMHKKKKQKRTRARTGAHSFRMPFDRAQQTVGGFLKTARGDLYDFPDSRGLILNTGKPAPGPAVNGQSYTTGCLGVY